MFKVVFLIVFIIASASFNAASPLPLPSDGVSVLSFNEDSHPREYDSYLGKKLLELLENLKERIDKMLKVATPEVEAALEKMREAVEKVIRQAGVAIGGGFILSIMKLLQLVMQMIAALEKLGDRLDYESLENLAEEMNANVLYRL